MSGVSRGLLPGPRAYSLVGDRLQCSRPSASVGGNLANVKDGAVSFTPR